MVYDFGILVLCRVPRWLLNAGGVAHGLGQEARPVLFSEPTTGAEPTERGKWRAVHGFWSGFSVVFNGF